LQLAIKDPKGNDAEFTGYYAAKDGRLIVTLKLAANDIKGTWTATATELAAGNTATLAFELK